MRTIKFRAWNGINMEYAAGCSKYGCFYTAPDPKDTASLITTLYDEKTPIMQFTGLFDKFGKEIYEGDIITDRLGKSKYVVEFKDGIFEPLSSFWSWSAEAIVIGNIYETPELLK